jgi:1-deoxy-D-xylulose-5-phosphate synthase
MTELPIGRAVTVREGRGVAILNFGALLDEALAAGEELDATVIDMRWVKPLDEALIQELAASHDLLLTLEENAIAGGAGAGVSELLAARGIDCPVRHLGLPDAFVEHGGQNDLRREQGLSRQALVDAVSAWRGPALAADVASESLTRAAPTRVALPD